MAGALPLGVEFGLERCSTGLGIKEQFIINRFYFRLNKFYLSHFVCATSVLKKSMYLAHSGMQPRGLHQKKKKVYHPEVLGWTFARSGMQPRGLNPKKLYHKKDFRLDVY